MAENIVPKLPEDTLAEMNVAMTNLLKIKDELGTKSAKFEAYQEKMDPLMQKFDDWQAKAVEKIAELEKKNAEAIDRVKHLEASFGMAGTAMKMSPEEKKDISDKFMMAFFKKGSSGGQFTDQGLELAQLAQEYPQYWMDYCNKISKKKFDGTMGLPINISSFQQRIEMERKTAAGGNLFRTDIGEFGGFLPSIEWATQIKSNIFEKTPMRQFCTVLQIGGKTLRQPIKVGLNRAYDEGETEEVDLSSIKFAQVEITPYRIQSQTAVSWEALQETQYNVSEEISNSSSEAFSITEGTNCVKGNGVRRALGFYNDPNIIPYTSITAATGNTDATCGITFNDLVKMTGMIKTGYKPRFYFNRRFGAFLRGLQDDQHRYLWNEFFGSAVAGQPAEIFGYTFTNTFIDMDDQTITDGHPVLFCDMQAYYQITDRQDLILIRDEYTKAGQALVIFNVMKWTTGQPIKSEAAVLMTRNG